MVGYLLTMWYQGRQILPHGLVLYFKNFNFKLIFLNHFNISITKNNFKKLKKYYLTRFQINNILYLRNKQIYSGAAEVLPELHVVLDLGYLIGGPASHVVLDLGYLIGGPMSHVVLDLGYLIGGPMSHVVLDLGYLIGGPMSQILLNASVLIPWHFIEERKKLSAWIEFS